MTDALTLALGGALVGANGADVATGRTQFHRSHDKLAARHHSAARMLRIALTLGAHRFSEESRLGAWCDFANVIFHRLTEEERIMLAYWSLRTLEPGNRLKIAQAALWGAR